MGFAVLLYVPNIIGYVRLVLIGISWLLFYTNHWYSALLYLISILLDGLDGYAARRLNQCSAFGAWLDVTIDLIGRGMMWSRIFHYGYLMIVIEWICFVCTHAHYGSNWKNLPQEQPQIVRLIMAKGYKTPLGCVAICGVHGLPLWMYAHYFTVLDELSIHFTLQYLGICLLSSGRAVAFVAESWYIWCHLCSLLNQDSNIQPREKTLSVPLTNSSNRQYVLHN